MTAENDLRDEALPPEPAAQAERADRPHEYGLGPDSFDDRPRAAREREALPRTEQALRDMIGSGATPAEVSAAIDQAVKSTVASVTDGSLWRCAECGYSSDRALETCSVCVLGVCHRCTRKHMGYYDARTQQLVQGRCRRAQADLQPARSVPGEPRAETHGRTDRLLHAGLGREARRAGDGAQETPQEAQRQEARPTQGQERALEAIESGKNVFLFGNAGCGKSKALEWALEADEKAGRRVALTATTGIAALNIAGRTLHSWAGLRPNSKSASAIAADPRWQRTSMWAIRRAQRLYLDETSMASAALLDLVEELCRIAKGNSKPWGGLSVVLIGDLGQLPPVEESEGFCFQSAAWAKSGLVQVELTQVMRQKDEHFVRVLNEVRLGKLSAEGEAVLGSRVKAFDPDDPQAPALRVMTHNVSVDKINAAKLAALPGQALAIDAIEFSAPHAGGQAAMTRLDKDCLSPRRLELKIGARVMFTRNAPTSQKHPLAGAYVNGSAGTVVDLQNGIVHVKIDRTGRVISPERAEWTICGTGGDSDVLASRMQLPLRCAWACSIHKTQGLTLDKISIDLVRCFAPGQAYVAISRCRTLEGLNVEDWRGAASIFASAQVLAFLGKGAKPFGALW